MSRAFVDNDQGYDASPRVYVNNMNTPQATVSLPERRADNRVLRRGTGGATGNGAELANTTGGGGGYSGARVGGGGAALTTSGATSAGTRAGQHPHRKTSSSTVAAGGQAATTARGDVVHPNLQDVYNRIMRRLQRQMNYAELSRASLAEQYGVDLELQCEAEEAAAASSNPLMLNDGGEHDGRRVGTTRSGSAGSHSNNYNNSGTSASGSAAAAHGGASALSQTSRMPTDSERGAMGEESRPGSQSFSLSVTRTRLPGSTTQSNGTYQTQEQHNPDVSAKQSSKSARGNNGSGKDAAATHAGAAAGTSRLLQFRQQPLPAASSPSTNPPGAFDEDGGATASAAGGGEGRHTQSDADVEREMAEQPCPRPLRLVVRHVLDTLQKKMTLAENGSLRDCIIFSFESRALLDRLLKEIPLYTQYTAYGANGGGSGSAAVQQAVSGVYQQLRKRPVLLPRGEYVEEAATGAIRAELVGTGVSGADFNSNVNNFGNGGGGSGGYGAGALSSAAATTRLPNLNVFPASASTQLNTSGNNNNTTNGAYNLAAHAALPEVPLPAGYGKSTRLAASAARMGSAATNNNNNVNNTSPMQPLTAASQRSLRYPILRDHLSTTHGSVSVAADSFDDVSELMTSGYADRRYGGSNTNDNNAAGSAAGPHFSSEAAAAHRATQLVSVGTITDDNGVTTVPQADYAALQQRITELQTQLADAQQHRSALAEQLCEEEQYTDQKKRIIQYLRETLVRECNMLRTQLHHATSTAAAASAMMPLPSGGKGGVFGQRGNNTGLYKEGSMVTGGGLNASTHSYIRQPKPSNGGTALSASTTTMGVSALLPPQQPKPSVDRPSEASESLGSMYGGNISVTANATAAGGAGGRNFGNASRTSPQFRLGGNNNNMSVGGSRGAPNFSLTVSGAGGGRADTFQAEVDAVHSLLDLALLAVEEEAVLPPHAAQQLRSGHGDKEVLRSGFKKNAKQQLDELRVDFEERQHALKKTLLQQTAEHNYVVAEQQTEVERLRALTDTSRVRAILQESVAELRSELHRVRMHVAEQLHFFKAILHSTGQGLLHRAALVDSTMNDNVTLSSTLSATKELIESANSLFLPMLTREYECGYHPWPLKVRNTRDPLGHIVQLRFGTAEVVRLRDSLSEFGKLYVAMHQYVMGHAVLPESARPTTGKALEDLCAAMALNPISHTEIVFAARRCHDVEGQLRKKLARLQSRILWNAYLQRVYTERSVAALAEAGIDPRVAVLPVARRIDVLAQQRGDMLQARVKIQRERSENAKELYRLWREKEIDIMEGYPTPQTQRNRLALLSSNSGSVGGGGVAAVMGVGDDGGGPGVGVNSRGARFSLLLKRHSADRTGATGSISL